jgi:hypothetical protein
MKKQIVSFLSGVVYRKPANPPLHTARVVVGRKVKAFGSFPDALEDIRIVVVLDHCDRVLTRLCP